MTSKAPGPATIAQEAPVGVRVRVHPGLCEGWGNCHRFAPAVYRFAPLRMTGAQRASIHGVDERVEIASLERGELFHRTLLQRLQ